MSSATSVPSLALKTRRVHARLDESGLVWHEGPIVARIPYGSVDTVTTEGAGGSRVRLRVTLASGHGGEYRVVCAARAVHLFAAALDRLARDARDDGVPVAPVVTVSFARRLPLHERMSTSRILAIVLVATVAAASAVLAGLGHPGRAVAVWLAIPAYALTAVVARMFVWAVGEFWIPWTRGIRVEAHYTGSRVSRTRTGNWPEFTYEFTGPDGVLREHARQASSRFSRPAASCQLRFVPGDIPRTHTMGEPYTALFISIMTGLLTPAFGYAAIRLLPGLLLGALPT